MRRGFGMGIAALSLLGACNDPLEWGAIDVRASAGPVAGNTVSCSGERRGICDPNYSLRAHANQGAITLSTQTPFLLGVMIRFAFEDDAAVDAEGRYITWSDDDNDAAQITVPIGGWVAPDQISVGLTGRQTGSFRLDFGDSGIDGTYDTDDDEPNAAMR